VTAGPFHTCGIVSGGAGYCWGDNFYGELGTADTTGRGTPTAVAGGLTFASMLEHYVYSCGTTTGGSSYCWGDNSFGELGVGTSASSASPVLTKSGLTMSASRLR